MFAKNHDTVVVGGGDRIFDHKQTNRQTDLDIEVAPPPKNWQTFLTNNIL